MYLDTMLLDQSTMGETRTMKRKRSADLAVARCLKRQLDVSTPDRSGSSLLINILREYGLLEAVVSDLFADDLLALALTSRALHKIIMPQSASLGNLLGRVRCSGKGINIRKSCHEKSPFFYSFDCTEYVQCGSATIQRSVETRPCVTCKVATCNECRVHCVYQSIHEASSDPTDPAELPNFSGFVLLEPSEQPILSPHHLISEEAYPLPHWQNPALGRGGPYHDQGYLDVPLQLDATAPPECIKDVLDFDLGRQALMSISEDSRYGSPSPVLMSLCSVVDARKIFLCDICFERDAPKGPKAMRPLHKPMPPLPWLARAAGSTPIKPCHCTLRNRFLDRWLCLHCYQKEDSTIGGCTTTIPMQLGAVCRCGLSAHHTLCLWCWGEVNEQADFSDSDTHDAVSSPEGAAS